MPNFICYATGSIDKHNIVEPKLLLPEPYFDGFSTHSFKAFNQEFIMPKKSSCNLKHNSGQKVSLNDFLRPKLKMLKVSNDVTSVRAICFVSAWSWQLAHQRLCRRPIISIKMPAWRLKRTPQLSPTTDERLTSACGRSDHSADRTIRKMR